MNPRSLLAALALSGLGAVGCAGSRMAVESAASAAPIAQDTSSHEIHDGAGAAPASMSKLDDAKVMANAPKLAAALGHAISDNLGDDDSAPGEIERLRAELADKHGRLVAVKNSAVRRAKDRAHRRAIKRRADRQLAEKLRATLASAGIKVSAAMRQGQVRVSIPSSALFVGGGVTVSRAGLALLKRVAPLVASMRQRRFLVAGHTDSSPIKRGTKGYRSNWELSSLRAMAVMRALVAAGVAGQKLSVAGFGDKQPARDGDAKGGAATNRRIELVLLPSHSRMVAAR